MQNTLNTDTNWEISVLVCQLHFPSNSVLGFVPGFVSILCLTCLISLPLHSTEEQTLLVWLSPESCERESNPQHLILLAKRRSGKVCHLVGCVQF